MLTTSRVFDGGHFAPSPQRHSLMLWSAPRDTLETTCESLPPGVERVERLGIFPVATNLKAHPFSRLGALCATPASAGSSTAASASKQQSPSLRITLPRMAPFCRHLDEPRLDALREVAAAHGELHQQSAPLLRSCCLMSRRTSRRSLLDRSPPSADPIAIFDSDC